MIPDAMTLSPSYTTALWPGVAALTEEMKVRVKPSEVRSARAATPGLVDLILAE